jgi:hypothetical protein
MPFHAWITVIDDSCICDLQVVRTQRQLFDIEYSQAVDEARAMERELHADRVTRAITQLDGIETALQSRVVQVAIVRSQSGKVQCNLL